MTDVLTVPEVDAIEIMYDKGWTDGLPVVPPTPAKVAAMLAAGGREPDEILGSVPARRKTVNAEIVAINAVMAGCKPEYFPIVVTAVEAVLDPAFNINTVATSTGGAAICVMVSGPMAEEIGMNGLHNALGSGNRANATIGRAVRLVVANVLGAKTGKLDASSVGHPGKYSFCFAERPPVSPWQTLTVEKGYAPEDTTVTIMATEGPRQVANHLNEDPAGVLLTFAAAMKAANQFIVGKSGQVTIVVGHEHELALRNGGWSKLRAIEFLVENSRVTPAEIEAAGIVIETGAQHNMTPGPDGKLAVVASVNDIVLITAGGPGSGWSAMIPSWAPAQHSHSVTRRVRPVGEAMPDCGPDGCEVPWLTEEFIKGTKEQSA
jgi:hypothetical protein